MTHLISITRKLPKLKHEAIDLTNAVEKWKYTPDVKDICEVSELLRECPLVPDREFKDLASASMSLWTKKKMRKKKIRNKN